jgi:hypothetical protein
MSDLTATDLVRKLKRLTAMGPRELAHRARAKAYAEMDRIRAHQTPPAASNFKLYLKGAPASRFYRSHRENLRPFVEECFPEWIDRAVEEAARLCRHEVRLLGFPPVQLGAEINWHRDPVTSQVWERRFWADYRPDHDVGGRDPKIIHELTASSICRVSPRPISSPPTNATPPKP